MCERELSTLKPYFSLQSHRLSGGLVLVLREAELPRGARDTVSLVPQPRLPTVRPIGARDGVGVLGAEQRVSVCVEFAKGE